MVAAASTSVVFSNNRNNLYNNNYNLIVFGIRMDCEPLASNQFKKLSGLAT